MRAQALTQTPEPTTPKVSAALPRAFDRATTRAFHMLRRLDPYYRDQFDHYLRPGLQALTQLAIRASTDIPDLPAGAELVRPDEEEVTEAITQTMNRFLVKHYANTGKTAERAGNTKTYGLLKAFFQVENDIPERFRHGLFRSIKRHPAYVRFAGPGPLATPDIENNGILSIGIKIMGVPGRKLMKEEKHTQDFLGISSPTFTTPDVYENLKLQQAIELGAPAWYFINPRAPHLLDAVMQGLYARTHANPLELDYYSCVPFSCGPQRAVKYRFRPLWEKKSKVGKISDDYLHEAMVNTLANRAVHFDVQVQEQTEPACMPIENTSVIWPEHHSPWITVAKLHIPAQRFNSKSQMAFARNMKFNPWHALPAHRPLGNQNRARKAIYQRTSTMRQQINGETFIEPTGDEVFN